MCALVFCLPRIVLETNSKYKTKIFKSHTKEWTSLTKSSRMCKDISNVFDIVYGPMVANPTQVAHCASDPITHSKIKFQIAFKGERTCDLLNKCWVGTIFFDKQKINKDVYI